MNRLSGFLRLAFAVFACWIALGTLGLFLGLGLSVLAGNGPAVWAVFALALVLALMVAVFASQLQRALPGPQWLTRVIVVTTPLFFCTQLTAAGTPDWDPRPLLAGWVFCAGASYVAWRRLRVSEETLGTRGQV